MIKPRQFFNISINKETKVVDIFIYGVIGYGWYSEESREAFEFVQEFSAAEKDASRINIRINSPGGIIEEGLPIYNAINSCKVETHAYIDGIAYSMAAIIALAADTVHIAPNGLFLLHNASGWAAGNAKDFRATADDLDRYDSALATSIVSKTGLTEDQVKEKWFDYEDHLMTAQEAFDNKLVDIITDNKADIPEDISNWDLKKIQDYFGKDDSKSQSFFDQILSKVKAALHTSNPDNKNSNSQNMIDLKKITDALNLTIEDLNIDNLISAIQTQNQDALQTITDERDTAVQDLALLNQAIAANTVLVDALGEEVAAADTFPAKIKAVKTKLDKVPGRGPTVVPGANDDGNTDEVDWDAINALEHNKVADQLI